MSASGVGSPGRPLRVMAAIGSLATGGSERQLTTLLTCLPRDRFDPVLVTITGGGPDDDSPLAAALHAAGVPVWPIGAIGGSRSSRWVRLVSGYSRALAAFKPDIVYAWLDESAAYLAPLCRMRGVPCLVARRNVMGSATERANELLGWLIRRAESFATLLTANSTAVAAASVRRGHKSERIRLVPNGHVATPPLPTPQGSTTVFGYVAQFRPEKGHHRLLDALELLPDDGWRVDLAGVGDLRPVIEARVAAAGLRDRVRFVGEIADPAAFWHERHVALLLSDSEGLPNALIEAAFAGRPVIATRVGGTPEAVGDEGAILVAADDPAETSRAMRELLHDPARREQMGLAIWRHVSDSYALEKMVRAHIEVLEETARCRPRRQRAWLRTPRLGVRG